MKNIHIKIMAGQLAKINGNLIPAISLAKRKIRNKRNKQQRASRRANRK